MGRTAARCAGRINLLSTSDTSTATITTTENPAKIRAMSLSIKMRGKNAAMVVMAPKTVGVVTLCTPAIVPSTGSAKRRRVS